MLEEMILHLRKRTGQRIERIADRRNPVQGIRNLCLELERDPLTNAISQQKMFSFQSGEQLEKP